MASSRYAALLLAAAVLAAVPAASLASPISIGNINGASHVFGVGVAVIQGNAVYGAGTPLIEDAISFVAPQDFQLTSVQVAIGKIDPSDPASGFVLDLYSNQYPFYLAPKNKIATLGSVASVTNSYSAVTTFSESGLSLIAGTRYWLVASPYDATSSLGWTIAANSGPFAESDFGNGTWFGANSNSTSQYAFQVEGETPEPASLWLLATGLLGLACLSRRFRVTS